MAASRLSAREQQSSKVTNKLQRWTGKETKLLIVEWSEPHIQAGLRDLKRNISIFKDLQARLQGHGYKRTAEQIKLKLKYLKKEYTRVKNHNNVNGPNAIDCDFFEDLDAILGAKGIATADSFQGDDITDSPRECQETPIEMLHGTPTGSPHALKKTPVETFLAAPTGSPHSFQEIPVEIFLATPTGSPHTCQVETLLATPTSSPLSCNEIPCDTVFSTSTETQVESLLNMENELEDTEMEPKIEEFTQTRKRKCNDWIDKFIEYDRTEKKLAQEARCRLELQLAEKQEKAMREENEKNRILLDKINQREIEHEVSMMKIFTSAIVSMSKLLKK
ncbi:hypothetical protein CHUAL_014241 [Chamberlinius hualienensis]